MFTAKSRVGVTKQGECVPAESELAVELFASKGSQKTPKELLAVKGWEPFFSDNNAEFVKKQAEQKRVAPEPAEPISKPVKIKK